MKFGCVFVRREFNHFRWFRRWKITDQLRKNYGKITHKSLTNHALQRIGTHTYANNYLSDQFQQVLLYRMIGPRFADEVRKYIMYTQ